MTQQHLADTLGMSLVNFNTTLQRMRALKSFTLSDRKLEIRDPAAMLKLAAIDESRIEKRPLI